MHFHVNKVPMFYINWCIHSEELDATVNTELRHGECTQRNTGKRRGFEGYLIK